MKKNKILVITLIILALLLLVRLCGGSEYDSFAGTYRADLTIVQSGHQTTIVINPDGSGYFQDGESFKSFYWCPADNGGGIKFSGGGSDEQSCYYMNKEKNKMYWGLNNFMNNRNGYKVKKVK